MIRTIIIAFRQRSYRHVIYHLAARVPTRAKCSMWLRGANHQLPCHCRSCLRRRLLAPPHRWPRLCPHQPFPSLMRHPRALRSFSTDLLTTRIFRGSKKKQDYLFTGIVHATFSPWTLAAAGRARLTETGALRKRDHSLGLDNRFKPRPANSWEVQRPGHCSLRFLVKGVHPRLDPHTQGSIQPQFIPYRLRSADRQLRTIPGFSRTPAGF